MKSLLIKGFGALVLFVGIYACADFLDVDVNNQLSVDEFYKTCLLYTSPSPRDAHESRMPSSA